MAEHPLSIELAGLRASLANHQQEAHATAAQLQRYALEATMHSEKTRFLARENAALREELTKLRQTPDTSPDRSALQVTELTLALRRMGEKLDLSEGQVLERTTELAAVRAERTKIGLEMQAMNDELSRLRAQEEGYKRRERAAETRCKVVEAEKDLVERVIQEYADLVRSLEARLPAAEVVPLPGPNRKPKHDLEVGKSNITNIAQEFSGESERLHREIARLEDEIRDVRFQLAAERKVAEEERGALASARSDLGKQLNDDNTASKLVSRYMRFSQSSSNDLQSALEALKARHAATLATLSLQVSNATSLLSEERKTSTTLRDMLDELSEDVAREAFGRRREISLRLALLGREERTAELLARWVRRATERREKVVPDTGNHALEEAKELLETINGLDSEANVSLNGHASAVVARGAVSRVILAQDAVNSLTHQLTVETERRLALQQKLLSLAGAVTPAPSTPSKAPPSALFKGALPSKGNMGTGNDMSFSTDKKALHGLSEPENDDVAQRPHKPLVVEDHLTPNSISTGSSNVEQPLVEQSLPSTKLDSHSQEVKPDEFVVNNPPHPIDLLSPDLPQPDAHSNREGPPPQSDPIQQIHVDESAADTPIPQLASFQPASLSPTLPPPSIINDLARALHRYDDLQRAFRDCHLTLSKLKSELAVSAQSSAASQSSSFFSTASSPSIGTAILQTAVSRLDDFNEDARVELEIRVGDDARLAKGYETFVSVPIVDGEGQEREDLEAEMRMFIDGTTPMTLKAIESFQRKRDDLLHDIARVKLVLHASSNVADDTGIDEERFPAPKQSLPGDFDGSISGGMSHNDPYAALRLRIAMPTSNQPGLGLGKPLVGPGAPRSRKTSAGMFALGLLSGGDGAPRTRTISLMGSRMRRVSSAPLMESREGEEVE